MEKVLRNKTIIDRYENSIVYTITNENREEVISSLLSHNYTISWKTRGKRRNLELNFKNQY